MMGHRHGMALIAGAATLLATLPMGSIFEQWTWFFNGLLAIAVVVGAATGTRALRGPAGVQVLASMAALLLVLTWRFPSGEEIAGIIPSEGTFLHFDQLLRTAGEQIRSQAVPVPDLDGLLLLAMAGVGLVAVLVDLAAVGVRRPALAGLPMLALYSVPVAVLPDGRVDFFAFAAAAVGYLWLLVSDSVDRVRRFGRRFSGEGRDVDVWEPSPLSAAGRRLGAVVIAIAVLLPLAIPSMSSTLMQRFAGAGGPGDGPGAGGGELPIRSVDMNAMLRDNLTLNEVHEMVVVRTNDPSPFYLRLGVAERVDENGFYSDMPSGTGFPVSEPLPNGLPTGPVTVVGSYRAEINVTGLSLSLAPMYSQLTAVEDGLDGWALDPETGQVWSNDRNINDTTYTIRYSRLSYPPEDLRNAPRVPPDVSSTLTNVPDSDYVADLVDELTEGLSNQYDRVRALYDYFRGNGFSYSLTTVDGDSGSAIVDFLQNKKGFCVQYAAALTWLVREAGYAARVAFGFTRGSGRNGTYPLTNLNLHAWTEVYFPSFGWVPFDATPGSAVPGSVTPPWAGGSPNSTPPTGQSGSPGQSASPTPPRGVDPGEAPVSQSPVRPGPGIEINPISVGAAAGVLVLLVLLVAPSLQRRIRRRRRLAAAGGVIALTPPIPGEEDLVTDPEAMTQAQRDAHNAWAELLDTMIDYGVLVDPAETPRATAGRLSETPQVSISGHVPTALLARVEERARYAPAPVRPTNLDEAVRSARKAFAEDATLLQRLRVAVFPRSVLMQWRTAWFGLMFRTSRKIGRIRDAVLLVKFRENRRRK